MSLLPGRQFNQGSDLAVNAGDNKVALQFRFVCSLVKPNIRVGTKMDMSSIGKGGAYCTDRAPIG
jgi:hypothetical protein